MTSRHFKTAAAAVGVLLAFAFVYDRVFHVQPVVENPPTAYRLNQGDGQTEADGENRSETDTQDGAEEGDSLERVAPELVSLFPPGDWRRTNANILIPAGRECFFFSQGSPRFEADSKILVLGKGTLVFLGEKKPGETDEERADRAIVFESEDDMTLEDFKEAIEREDDLDLYNRFESSRNYRNSMPSSSAGPIKKAFAVYCDIIDEAGGIAAIATILASNIISIKNIGIVHNREFEEGVLRIEFYDEDSSKRAVGLLQKFRYIVYER